MDIDIISRLSSSSALMGMLPENPGYIGSILLIDDIEAERISKDINDAIEEIESLRNQLSTNTPEGWVLVPIEPTESMILALSPKEYYSVMRQRYQAMLNAAPTHKER